jgi:hypothetical protein
MEQKNRFSLEESVEEKYEVHPYAIFFKNFTMVHRPMVRTPSENFARALTHARTHTHTH